MMKRIIALLLALILTVGLLPTVALAADGENPTTDSGSVTKEASKDNLNLVKTVTKEGDNYKVTLESWATGTVTSSSTPVPMDIILLLDQSGSMKKNFTSSSTETYNNLNKKNKKIYADYRNNCYIKSGNQYLKVTVTYQWEFGFSNDVYTYTWNGGSHTSTGGNSKPKIPLFYKSTTNSSTTRIAALKTAVSSFINKVNTEATTKNVDHRVAVVGFASTKDRSGNYKNTELLSTKDVVNYGSVSNIDYKNALVSATDKTRLSKAVDRLDANGDTYPEYGFDMANKIFAQHPIQDSGNRQRIVIMFTDGYPAPANTDNFNVGMANNAINNAKRCKDNNAKVYTIGIFDGADPSASIENYSQNGRLNETVAANRYMHFSSSNYPSAMALNNGGTKGEGNFYFAASNADALNDIFDTISEEISTDTTELDDSATIIDNIPGNFAIPEDAKNITLKVAKFQKDGTFATATTAPTTVTAEHKDGTVTVTGFNFSDEWCGLNESDQPHGSKLIIEFTIHHNNYGGTQPTNAGASIKDKEGNEVIKVDDPAIPVKITEPSITGVTRSKVYDGTGFDVLSTIAEDINALADGEKNAYVDIVVTVTSGSNTYTYTISKGATTGSWDKTGLTTEKDVKIENGAVSSYTYDLSITFKDATANGAAAATKNATATYTITKRPVTLTSGSDEKKYDGTPLTKDEVIASTSNGVGFVTGEGATYNVTGSQTNVGSSDNTFTYTLNEGTKATNYEITQETGTLTVKPIDQEVVITIKGQIVTATYDGEEKTASGYTVTVPEGVDADKITVAVAEGKTVPSVSATNATTTALVQTITADMFTVTSPYKKVTIKCENGSLTINPRKVKMISGSASKPYDGTALTNNTVTDSNIEGYDGFVNGEGATYSFTGTITDPGSKDNVFTYTLNSNTKASNYDITTAYGTLTITGSKTYTITFKTTNDGKINDAYDDVTQTVNAGADFPNRPTTTPNTGYYFDGWYKDNIKVTPFPEKVTENATYTAKWLSYNSINLDLTGKIQKTLNSDVELSNQSFEINLTLNGAEVASATASATVSPALGNGSYTDTKPFVDASGDFKLTFTAPGAYTYSIVEEAPTRSGMTYDVNKYNATGHTMTVVVKEDAAHALSVTRVTVDGNADTDATWLTITNNYVEPKDAQVTNKEVVVTQPEGALKTAVYDFEITSGPTVLYPTGNGTTSNTLEVSYGTTEATLLYKITVYAGTESSYTFEDKDASFVYAENAKTVTKNGDYFTVTFEDGAEYAYVYVAVTHAISYDADGEYKARNFIGSQGAETTVTEKDPNKLTINFADFVKKELTATGSKTANDVKFRVIVNGMESPYMMYNVGEEEVSTYAAFDPKYSTVLNVNFASITGGNTETEWFIADNSIVIDQAGIYYFELNEEDGKRTGVTYDDSIYKVLVYVERKDDKLVVKSFDIMKDNVYVDGDTITFHNTIDTGKDDYYPIIIPTIINKDTGMLNKTDHFAYVIGYPDGTVHPNGQITRAEVATIFFRLLKDEVRDGAFTTSNSYSDVAYGKWYNNPISTMSALGIITGYPDGTFKPNKPITRAEFAAIAARFDETQSGKSATFSDVIGHWAAKEIGIAYANDWIKGYPDGTFKPDQNITRAEAMTLINRVLERKPESPADLLTNMNKWTDNMDTSKWYYLDVQEATNSHGYTRKTFNYELWRQMLPDPDWSRYER